MSLRILLADSQLLFQQAVVAALRQEGFEVVAQASNGQEAVKACRRLQPDVAILDASMFPLNGIEVARVIIPLCPKTQTVILSEHIAELCVPESLRAGIHGFVLKTDTVKELAQAVYVVSRGKTYIAPSVSSVMKQYPTRSPAEGPLSVRERQLLRLIAEGRNTKEIADLLSISCKTVRAHRDHIMQKLDIHDTAGLVRYSIDHGLLEVCFDLQRYQQTKLHHS
jgi:two-component system, NarL family, response regulator NreC